MRRWHYEPSPLLDKRLAETLTVFPREQDMTVTAVRALGRVLLTGFLRIYFRLSIRGRGNLPAERSFVLAANHSSHLDAVCLMAALPLRKLNHVFAVAARDYFFCSFWKSLASVLFVNALPFDRQGRQRESLELCADVLRASDRVLIMFPEGTRSTTGEIQPFKAGLGALVAGSEQLVVPAFIRGAHRAWPKSGAFPAPRKVSVTIGAPLSFSAAPRKRKAYDGIARDVENAVRRLQDGEERNMSGKRLRYAIIRGFLRTVGCLSDGIRLCYREGLTSGKMLDYVYRNQPSGRWIVGRWMDRRFLADPGWAAIRQRRANLERMLLDALDALWKRGQSVFLLDIASGPGAYVLSVVEAARGKGAVSALCRDFETRWVEEGNRDAARRGLASVRFERGDAFDRAGLLALSPRPNLVVASGFYDWFVEEDKIRESMRIVFELLEPGGLFVLSTQCGHPNLEFTEQVFTDFRHSPLRMTMRPQAATEGLLRDIGFAVEASQSDAKGYFAVIRAARPG